MFSILDILSCFGKEKKYITCLEKDYHDGLATVDLKYLDEITHEMNNCTLILYPNGLVLVNFNKMNWYVSDKFVFLIKRMVVKWKRFCKRNNNGQE